MPVEHRSPLCRRCRWFDPSDEEALDGLCRASLPVMQGVIAPHGDTQFQKPDKAIWPTVNADDWCAMFAEDVK